MATQRIGDARWMDDRIDVLVVGAGIAGLTAARMLHAGGVRVAVLEKSRGYGGRAASRSIDGARVDHGAQYFTARSDAFLAQVTEWQQAGVVTPWAGGIWTQRAGSPAEPPGPEAHPRFIAPEGMNALGKALAAGLRVQREAEVTRIQASGRGWVVTLTQPAAAPATRLARSLLITAPLPQALALLSDIACEPAALAAAQHVRYAPCFALMAGYARDAGTPPWPGLRPTADNCLAFLAYDASKRPAPHPTTLVLHTTPAWTRANFERDPAEVSAALLTSAANYWPAASNPSWTRLHRWRYAQPEVTHPASFLRLAPTLMLAGDAFGTTAGRIEGAFLSAQAAAAALIRG